jgi:hypothetical protein
MALMPDNFLKEITVKSFPATIIACGLAFAAPAAFAQSASAQSASMGATTGLGVSHRFPTPDAAAAHCPGDTVVWSSGKTLTYQPANGQSGGFYACKMEADDAGFQPAGQ